MYSYTKTLQNYLTSHGIVSEGPKKKKIFSVIFSCHVTSANTHEKKSYLFVLYKTA